MESVMSELTLLFTATASGTLAATPFIWCFLFRSLMSFDLFATWHTTVYTWSVIIVHSIILACCCRRRSFLCLSSWVECLASANVVLTLIAFVWGSLSSTPPLGLPILCVLNAVLLALWVPVTYQRIYLCSYMTQRAYENGFLLAFVFYYAIVAYRLYLTPIFLVPFCLFLAVGVYGFKCLEKHDHYDLGLQRCKAIFAQGQKDRYVVIDMATCVRRTARELFVTACLTVSIVPVVCFLDVHTTNMRGLSFYVMLFYCGALSITGIVANSQFIVLVYACAAAIVTAMLYVFGDSLNHALGACLLAVLFFIFFNALGHELNMIRQKLSKTLNGPMFSLLVATLCNIVVTLTFLCIGIKTFK